jgi:hypothetical protein
MIALPLIEKESQEVSYPAQMSQKTLLCNLEIP